MSVTRKDGDRKIHPVGDCCARNGADHLAIVPSPHDRAKGSVRRTRGTVRLAADHCL